MIELRVLICTMVIAGCTSANKESTSFAMQPGIDELVSEQVSYAELGKTRLSQYGFFEGPLANLTPTARVLPYDLNTPLFSDYALKKRFIYLPEGKQIGFRDHDVFEFPEGTALIKNFYYEPGLASIESAKIIETRLLLKQQDQWISLPYVWNKEQTEAFLEITGGDLEIELTGKGVIKYGIPTMTECKSCHDRGGVMVPIGPSARQLNRQFEYEAGPENQLMRMASLGWLELPGTDIERLAVWNDPGSGSLEERARAYLDINCAHCHNDAGPAKNSGLNLSIGETDLYKLGLNKKPVAAGRGSADLQYGIDAGNPDRSILVHRMAVNDPGTRMPEIGRSIPHEEGISLIREWILSM